MNDSGGKKGQQVHPLYQRVLGGVVLLALAAIIIPALFDLSQDTDLGIQGSNIPPMPENMRIEVLPLPPPDPIVMPHEEIKDIIETNRPGGGSKRVAPVAVTVTPKQGEEKSPAKTKTVNPKPQISSTKKSMAPAGKANRTKDARTASRHAALQKATNASSPGDWFVQVGSFGSIGNADRLKSRIASAGFDVRVYPDRKKGQDGVMNRVWVGPSGSESKAKILSRQLNKRLKLKGLVIHRPGISNVNE